MLILVTISLCLSRICLEEYFPILIAASLTLNLNHSHLFNCEESKVVTSTMRFFTSQKSLLLKRLLLNFQIVPNFEVA